MSRLKTYIQTHTNPPVFLISGGIMLVMVAWASLAPAPFAGVANEVNDFITTYFDWLYVFSMAAFLVFVLGVAFSRAGNLRLGPDDSRPEFGTFSWLSMMFTCGMGVGLVYYGVAEPVMLYQNPPFGEPETVEAAKTGMNYTFYHWGLHPWGAYIVLGLALGYFSYRRGLPLKPASAFYPLIGDRINGPIGHTIDILAVFGTLFGLATSIGLGASQIAAGLSSLLPVSSGLGTQLAIIFVVELVAIASVMMGISAGIRRLSLFNAALAGVLALFVFIAGPTLYILSYLGNDLGYYIQNLPLTSLRLFTDEQGEAFQTAWTLFNWGWFISWSPFVGMFIARISHGYTIRQFILGTLLVPSGASIIWFVIFGRTALYSLLEGGGNQALLDADASHMIFVVLDALPVAGTIAGIAAMLQIVVVTLFFATSSDSGSLVVDILTNGGDPHPIWQQRLFWAILEGVIAAVLLIAGTLGGGNPLSAIQTASVASGLPFCFVLLGMCFTLQRAMSEELRFASPAVSRA
ncbi:BCCT family transporter [uncultured Salinisphaera sp.]|uniref:BCCT family transporter n=1 Tax=uncultured Salinisphaera sp. TaxID=359372 RepID=UPI0032B27098